MTPNARRLSNERAILNLKIANISRRLAINADNRGEIANAREYRRTAAQAETVAALCLAKATPTPDYMAQAQAMIAKMRAEG